MTSQSQSWNDRASAWGKWCNEIEKSANIVSEHLIQLAQIEYGDKVLDIATGEPAITAARYTGVSGSILALDISAQMLKIAKQRAVKLGFQNIIKFKDCAIIESADLPYKYFNAALSRWGLMFIRRIDKALRNIRKSLVPGGRFAAVVWGKPSHVPLLPVLTLAFEPVMKHINISQHQEACCTITKGPFSLCDANVLRRYFDEAGFREIKVETAEVIFEIASVLDYVNITKDLSAPIRMMLRNEPIETQEVIWHAVADAAHKYLADNKTGYLRLPNEVIYIVGQA